MVCAHLGSAADALGSVALAREACAANARQLRELEHFRKQCELYDVIKGCHSLMVAPA